MKHKKAVVLLSGGLDSSTVLYYAVKQGYECSCLLFDYGQRHSKELRYAAGIARAAGCAYRTVKIRLPWSNSSLTDTSKPIPERNNLKRPRADAAKHDLLPSTYVPGRNTVFISFALSYAEASGADAVFIGANAVDFSGYPDCRPDYYLSWNRLLGSLGTRIRIHAPLISLDKAGIVTLGRKLGVPFEKTWSCYKGGARPCGVCDSCRFREKGFKEAGTGKS